MARQRMGVGAVVFLVGMLCPRVSSADMMDVIYKMSGPQLLSVLPFAYRVPLPGAGRGLVAGIVKNDKRTFTLWDVVPLVPRPPAGSLDVSSPSAPRTWFVLDINAYASTSKDANETTKYDGWGVKMLAVEPRYDRLLYTSSRLTLYAGAGVSYGVLWGDDFSTFDKFAFKFRPVGIMLFDTIDLGFNIRVYPNGYTSDEFHQTASHYARPAEAVYGFSGGVAWSKKSK